MSTDAWTHYVVLAGEALTAQEEGVAFQGKAGLLRREGPVRAVALLSADGGKAGLDGLALETKRVASVRWNAETRQATGHVDGAARPVRLTLPGKRIPASLHVDGEKVEFSVDSAGLTLRSVAKRARSCSVKL